ncbi:MAG: patatin-like phospholipase family protein, partial [Bacteroidota bacterium]
MKSFRPNKKFKIGLVMAGAVTAGAYTAGVLDYLLSTLDLWYSSHKDGPNSIPKPNVVIETVTGASAGSIAAAGMILGLATRQLAPVKIPINEADNPRKNILYDIWVEFGLGKDEKI